MAKKSSNITARIASQKAKVLEHLSESGNVSYACKRAGVSRDTYYRWRSEDEQFAYQADAAIGSGKEFVNDLAHTKLMQSINEGHFPAVRFQLINCHKDYHPKKTTPPYHPEDDLEDISVWSIPAAMKLERYKEELLKQQNEENDEEATE